MKIQAYESMTTHIEASTEQLQGMLALIRDNRDDLRYSTQALWEMTLAAVQLSETLKLVMEQHQ